MERIAVQFLRPGHTCWRIEQADRVTLIVDAADYFRAARAAMLKAQHSILMIGWDFDTRIDLDPNDESEAHPRRSEEHTSELQSRQYLVCRLLLEKKKKN